MPNHITNRIKIIGTQSQVQEVFEKFNTHHPSELYRAYNDTIICRKKNKDEFSVGWYNEETNVFERRNEPDVIGLPDDWEYEYTVPTDQFPDFNKVIPQPENIFNGDLGKDEEEMCEREGRPTWYDWNRINWGTKWNSYSCEKISDNEFKFETAWRGVPLILDAISKAFPSVEFIYEYADEDTGSNTGILKFKNGLTDEVYPVSQSKMAYELAFKLNPNSRQYFKLVDGNYVYDEEA